MKEARRARGHSEVAPVPTLSLRAGRAIALCAILLAMCAAYVYHGYYVATIEQAVLVLSTSVLTAAVLFLLVTQDRRIQHTKKMLVNMAYYDALTGLPNRRLGQDRLEHAISAAHRESHAVALLFLDLDNFKVVNDTFGHAAGDECIKDTARLLTQCVRDSDTVARLGGDEFTVILEGTSSPSDVAVACARIVEVLALPREIHEQRVLVSASVGVALYPEDGKTAGRLMQCADIAMYHAKRAGKSSYRFFSTVHERALQNTRERDRALGAAVENGQLFVEYQPKVDLLTGQVVCLEALVRWRVDGEVRLPATFIERAERVGAINDIGQWVIREVCRQIKAWDATADSPPLRVPCIAVNVSPYQFREGANLVSTLRRALDDYGTAPERLELELTESAMLENPVTAAGILEEVHALGVRVSLDDFGTGYSSLHLLNSIPVDALKLDQGFTKGAMGDAKTADIVNAVIKMAAALKMPVTAEGVETEEQYLFLVASGCYAGQGYYFSRALAADKVQEYIASKTHTRVS